MIRRILFRRWRVIPVGTHTLHLTLREGRYHQVKRMVAAAGNRVSALERIQLGHFHLPKTYCPVSGLGWRPRMLKPCWEAGK